MPQRLLVGCNAEHLPGARGRADRLVPTRPRHADAAAVVNMLLAMFLGMGFHAGFIVDSNTMPMIAKQLHQLMTHGLLDRRQTGPPLTVTPPVAAVAAVDDFVSTWPGLAG